MGVSMDAIALQVLRWRGQPVPVALGARFGTQGGTVGRAPHNTLVLPDPDRRVARVHARVRCERGRFSIEDLGGDPLRVNGQVLAIGARQVLSPGDVVALGDYEVAVCDAASLPAAPPAPPPPAPMPVAEPSGAGRRDWDPFDDLAPSGAPVAAPSLDDLFDLGPADEASAPPSPPPSPPPAPAPVAPAAKPTAPSPLAFPDDWDPLSDSEVTRPGVVPTPRPAASDASIDDLFGLGDSAQRADPDRPADDDLFGLFGDPKPDPTTTTPPPPADDEKTVPMLVPAGGGGGRTRNSHDPVWFAVTAPPRFEAGRRFTAALAIHVESLRDRVAQQLARLGGPDAVPLLDLPPARQSGWRPGAPVTVRLQVDGAEAPAPVELEWNGRSALAVFQVQPASPAPQRIELVFHVLLAGVPMGLLPLVVDGASADVAAPAERPPRSAPSSAFASYASADADAVGLCLSALAHWAPALAIFQDCLDLRPGEAFKPQLERRIADADAFLLFWSRRAAASPWVRWELDTARRGKAPQALIPMPLEDPAIAPPPPELADRQWRDRFMVARYGLARIAGQAGR
ncbi:MAG: TIR domain-containing protein [Rubrivivax sp.]